jgi:antitoxin (DNA-binding transcriptional repressor) of toxin-antitoxin stability system
MQTTVTTAEAAANLSTLIEQSRSAPITIREGGEDVAFIVSVKPRAKTDAEREAAWTKFEATRNRVAADLETSLDQKGISVEDFLSDALKD